MKSLKLALSLGTLLALGSSLQASTINYAFGGLKGDLGSNTHTFTSASGPSIVASGYHVSGNSINDVTLSAVNLYSKGANMFPTATNDENGLGLMNDSTGDHEVTPGSFIMLDLGAFSNTKITDLTIYTGSTTDDEKWIVAGSNFTPFNASSLSQFQTITPGTTNGKQDIASLAGDRYIYFSSMDGNVLLGGVSVQTAAPEPASASLVGLMLAGAGLLFRRRFSK